jgi:hypothetical protein
MELELLIGLGLLVALVGAVYLMNKTPSITVMDDAGVIKTEMDKVREEIEEAHDLNGMTKKELIALAESKDVLVSARMKKAEIISKLL